MRSSATLPLLVSLMAVSCVHLRAQDAAESETTAEAVVYQLNVGDEIAITVVGEPDLEESLRIDSQGNINQKFLGLVPVAGRTITAAERHLEQQLVEQKFLRNPVVRMKLTGYAQRGVVVFGAVNQPGAVSFPPETFSMDILDVIAKCGGFTSNARRTNVRVKRRSTDGSEEMLTVNVRNLMIGKDSSPFPVVPGDVINVE